MACKMDCTHNDYHECCCECPDREECNNQCDFIEDYEYFTDCEDYVEESNTEY